MKKSTRIISTVMAGLMIVSAVPAISSSAATKVAKPKITVANVKKGVKITWKKAKGAKNMLLCVSFQLLKSTLH